MFFLPNFWTPKCQNKTSRVLTSWFIQKKKASAVFSHSTHKSWILLLDTAAWGIMDLGVKVNISITLFRLPVLFSASVNLYSAPTNVITLVPTWLYMVQMAVNRAAEGFQWHLRHFMCVMVGDVVKSEVPTFWFNTVGVVVWAVCAAGTVNNSQCFWKRLHVTVLATALLSSEPIISKFKLLSR